MRVLALAVVSLIASSAYGFVVPRPTTTTWCSAAALRMASSSTDADSSQWDAILSEGSSSSRMSHKARGPKQVVLPHTSSAHHNTLLASSIAVDPMADLEAELMGESSSLQENNEDYFEDGAENANQNMASTNSNTERVTQYIARKEQPRTGLQMPNMNMQTFLEGKDMTDITIFLIFPSIVGASLLKWAYGKAAVYTTEKTAELLEAYATEMCYHDGDVEEMKLAHKDYSRVKLAYLGPLKKDKMLKSFLTVYAKKKNVSPQSISTLSHVLTLYKLSEEKAAQVIKELCMELGKNKISSVGKLLFYATQILKSKEAKAALAPIKQMMATSYEGMDVDANQIVTGSQKAIGEAAYKFTVINGGKKQTKLPEGWKILGLKKETAQTIFEECQKEGFISWREEHYSMQSTKYDKSGRALDDQGKRADGTDPTEDAPEEEEELSMSTSNAFECGECGFTIFVAKGREFKFFGDNFKCPECGAGKDKFVGRSDD
eukprot:scaffold107872_cov51-Attheya_sp.AAC.2